MLLLQKEVAERLLGKNKLSTITNLWARPEILFYLKAEDFYPVPKVDSAVIRLVLIPKEERLKNEKEIMSLMNIGFSLPRKTLLNNLLAGYSKNEISDKRKKDFILDVFRGLSFDEKIRAQNLTKDDWTDLEKVLLTNE